MLNVFFCGVSGLCGIGYFIRSMEVAAEGSGKHVGRGIMIIWLLLYAFVGTQLGWTLRPFFGAPGQPFELFRKGKVSNFYENRYIGVFTAQHRVARLNERIAFLEAKLQSSERSPVGAEGELQEKKAGVEQLRRAVVGLSKTFSFISSETAFIALPEELRKKYGFIPQQYTTGQLYGWKGGKAAVVPEPETWLLIIGGGIMSVYFLWQRRRKTRDIRLNSSGKA